MLNRRKRGKILIKCLGDLYTLCKRRQNLFPDMGTEDLVEELGVHIWIALIRYRDRPYKQAAKIAYRVGVNRLTSIVRSKLTVIKRGSKIKFVPFDSDDPDADDLAWLSSKSMHSNGVQIIDALETIASTAIMKVGLRKANSLVKALLYDWRSRKPLDEQILIMNILKKDRSGVRKLVKSFISDIRRGMPIDHDFQMLEKIEGKWQAAGKRD